MEGGPGLQVSQSRPEARLGLALRRAREDRGVSLRALARMLHRSHSTLVEYERGHRLAPLDVVEAYESELGLGAGTLAAVHEGARLELYGEDRSHLRTYVVRPALDLPHQLPPDVAGFTGREAELSRLRAVVAEGAGGTVVISAIAGTAGVGKTALAVHLAHELAPDFPHLQLYVNLHGYEPAQWLAPTQVLDRFLQALGVAPDFVPTVLEDQKIGTAKGWHSHTSERRTEASGASKRLPSAFTRHWRSVAGSAITGVKPAVFGISAASMVMRAGSRRLLIAVSMRSRSSERLGTVGARLFPWRSLATPSYARRASRRPARTGKRRCTFSSNSVLLRPRRCVPGSPITLRHSTVIPSPFAAFLH
jgi:transcriptional regulator with XRE-family HTH domain